MLQCLNLEIGLYHPRWSKVRSLFLCINLYLLQKFISAAETYFMNKTVPGVSVQLYIHTAGQQQKQQLSAPVII